MSKAIKEDSSNRWTPESSRIGDHIRHAVYDARYSWRQIVWIALKSHLKSFFDNFHQTLTLTAWNAIIVVVRESARNAKLELQPIMFLCARARVSGMTKKPRKM